MTIKQFEIFLALAKTPHMRTVAQDFFLSQAAISSSLNAFEEEIGTNLFHRVNNKLVLNEKGKFLQERLIPLVGEMKNLMAAMSGNELAGDVRIGASTTIADFIIPQVVYDFTKKHKDVHISCQASNSTEVIRKVEAGEFDVGFVEAEVRSINLKVTPLMEERLLIVTADEDFAKAGAYPMASLMNKEWLLREKGSGTREVFLHKLATLGLRPRKFMEFNHYRPIKTLLKNPETLSCASSLVVAEELQNKMLFSVDIADAEFFRTFYRVEHKDKQSSFLVNLVGDAIQEQLSSPYFHKCYLKPVVNLDD